VSTVMSFPGMPQTLFTLGDSGASEIKSREAQRALVDGSTPTRVRIRVQVGILFHNPTRQPKLITDERRRE